MLADLYRELADMENSMKIKNKKLNYEMFYFFYVVLSSALCE